jgi:glycosyltransferase 2 family protein
MKLAVNLFLSLALLALFVWLVWPNPEGRAQLAAALGDIEIARFWPYLVGYVALLFAVHFCRSWRWNNLLAPIGVTLTPGRLLAISSVGFMAILALPARLGELVRPALIRRKGHVSAAAALGTVAVERIVDGLMVSLFLFGAFFVIHGPDSPSWMMPAAYLALGVFGAATIFLIFALRRPEHTVKLAVKLTFVERASPRLARRIEEKLLDMISGFNVLKDRRNLLAFAAWSLVYWVCNGLSMYVLAQGMGLPLSVMGSFATMALLAVGISVPNTPGLFGQFHSLTMWGVQLYLVAAKEGGPLYGIALAYAVVLHMSQLVWYLGTGIVALATPYVSLSEVWQARKLDPADAAGEHPVA